MPARPIRPTLLALLLAANAFGSTLSAPVAVDPGAAAAVPPYGDQVAARAATFDGGAFFVWNDYRAGGAWPDVYGARVRFDGQVLDPSGIAIATGPLAQEFADVACVGEVCLVAWRNGDRIEAARFQSDGTRLDASPIAVGAGASLHAVTAAASPTEFLVAWAQGTNINVQLVGTDGALIGSGASLARTDDVRTMNAASDGAGWMLTWSEALPPSQDQTRSVVFRPPSTFQNGPQILTTSSYPTFPDVAAASQDGGGFVSIWHTYPTGQFTGQVLSKRFFSDGSQLGGTITTNINGNVDFGFPSVSFDGTSWQIVYRNGPTGNLAITTMNVSSGVRTIPQDLSSGNQSALPVIAARGSQMLLAWSEGYGYTTSDLRHGVVQAGALVIDGGSLTVTGGLSQTAATGAFGAGVLMVIWEDDRSGQRQLRARRFDETGSPLAPAFALQPSADEQSQPAIAFDGEAFVVAWTEKGATTSVKSLRLLPDGTVLPPGVQTLADPAQGASRPSLAVGPDLTWALWSHDPTGAGDDVFVMRIARDGGLLDPMDRALIQAPGNQSNPSVALTPDGLCAAYQGRQPDDVELACFDAALSPLSAGAVLDATNTPVAPALAVGGGGEKLVVYSALNGSEGVEGKRVATDGGTEASFEVMAPSENSPDVLVRQSLPSLCWDGRAFAAAYEKVSLDGGTDVQLRRFDADGNVLDTLAAAESADEERFPALVPMTPGRVALLYSHFDRTGGGMRAALSVLTDVAEGQRCLAPTECRVGNCVSFICCTGSLCDVLADGGTIGADGGIEFPDGGASSDGGAGDGGETDGGEAGAVRSRLSVSCGCSSAGMSSGAIALLLLLKGARRRRA